MIAIDYFVLVWATSIHRMHTQVWYECGRRACAALYVTLSNRGRDV